MALEHTLLACVKPVTNLRSGHLALLHFTDPFDRLGPLPLRAVRIRLNVSFGLSQRLR